MNSRLRSLFYVSYFSSFIEFEKRKTIKVKTMKQFLFSINFYFIIMDKFCMQDNARRREVILEKYNKILRLS